MNTAGSHPKIIFVTNIQVAGGGEATLYELASEFGGVVFAPVGDVSAELEYRGTQWRRLRGPVELRRATNLLWAIELVGRAVMGWIEIAWGILIERPKVVHVNNLAAGIYALLPALTLRRKRLWHIHDVVPERSLEAILVRWMQYLANTIIVPSHASRDSLVNIGVSPRKIVTIPSGVDARNAFNPETLPPSDLRDELGIPNEALVIAVIGHIAPAKGVHLLVDAIEMLPNELRHKLHVLVVGTAPPRWASYEADLRRHVKQDGRFHFLGRVRDVPRILESADILVQASIYPEAFGRTVVEAMAMRKVVIASDAGALPTLVDDGLNGYLFQAGDAHHLASKLQIALGTRSDAQELTRAAREKVLAKFDGRVRNDLLREIYRM